MSVPLPHRALLDVVELGRRFPVGGSPWFRRAHRPEVHAVDDVSLTLDRGETLGPVGESGCGKSTLARMLARLLDPSSGSIRFGGRELTLQPARRFARDPDRAHIQVVFQDAGESINPRFTAADAIANPLRRLSGLRGAAGRGGAGSAAVRAGAGRSCRASRTSSPADSAAASASRARSAPGRRCLSWTSQRPRWTYRSRSPC